jgi:hypothetical protein
VLDLQQVQPPVAVDALACADFLRCLQRPAAREHGEPVEEPALRWGEQVVAPIDGGV